MYMAMPSASVVISDKMQYPSVGGVGWYADERDGFISWLRGEFAAANAIIDSLCHHLKNVGEGGEYDEVIGSIQQRRCNWNPVLHMQQYFSVAEVLYALQQVTWRRQQQNRGGYHDSVKAGGPGKEYKKSAGGGGVGSRQVHGHKVDIALKDAHNSTVSNGSSNLVKNEVLKSEEKDVTLTKYNNGLGAKPHVDSNQKGLETKSTLSSNSKCEAKEMDNKFNPNLKELKPNVSAVAKTFVGTEMFDGKHINVVEGMKMYDELFDDSDVGKMLSLVNDLRIAGRQGKFQGQKYIVSKRPMKGHGREMIQLGLPIADAPFEDEVINGTSKERRIEPIPSLFEDVIEHLMAMQFVTVKPDSCIIDFFNEGDHSQPHSWPTWFGRPVFVLFLTECDMTFGRVFGSDHPVDYRGSIKLSLTPGCMLVMEGRSADFARHAIPSQRKLRILVTFTKSQPKRMSQADAPRSPTQGPATPSSHWVPPPTRAPNNIRHPLVPKLPTPGVLPNLTAPRPQLHPPNSIQPVFIPAPAMTFQAPSVALPPASGGLTATPLVQHAPPRLPVPGTGVFLPPGSTGNSQPHKSEPSTPEKENTEEEDSNVNSNGNEGEVVAVGGEEKQNDDVKAGVTAD